MFTKIEITIRNKKKEIISISAKLNKQKVGDLNYNKKTNTIQNIFVKPDFRNQRIGKMLIHTLLFLYPFCKCKPNKFFSHIGFDTKGEIVPEKIDLKINPYIYKQGKIWYNTYNGNVVKISKSEIKKELQTLYTMGFYIPILTNFKAIFNYILEEKKKSTPTSATIVTTERCNLNCYYCFEKNKNKEIITNKKDYEKVWDKIKRIKNKKEFMEVNKEIFNNSFFHKKLNLNFKEVLVAQETLGIYNKNNLVGFIEYGQSPEFFNEFGIKFIGVLEKERGKHLGYKLIKAALQDLQYFTKKVYIAIPPNYAFLENYYKKIGFKFHSNLFATRFSSKFYYWLSRETLLNLDKKDKVISSRKWDIYVGNRKTIIKECSKNIV